VETGGGVDFTLPPPPQAARLASAIELAVIRSMAVVFMCFFPSCPEYAFRFT
jgi:hypothetical protein